MNKEIEKAAYKFAESQNDGSAFTAYYKGFISGAQFKENTDNVSLNKNTIPPMTNSLGKHWVQPDPSGFVLDDDYVLMSKLDFDLLPETPSLRVSITVKCGKDSLILLKVRNGFLHGVTMRMRFPILFVFLTVKYW